MLNAHNVNTCLLTSRESKFGSFSCSSKMTCLLFIGGDRSYHFWAVVVEIWCSCWSRLILPAPFMWTKCGNSVPSFNPWKWGRKKVGRSQEWRKGGKEARRREGRKKSNPHFVFIVYVLKGCLRRFVYGSSFCVLSLPWYLPFLEWFLIM